MSSYTGSKLSNTDHLAGFYCWAGPGTVRMIKTKYFDPEIDEASVLNAYELDYILDVKSKLNITDFWATFAWGFDPQTEENDYQFLVNRIDHFKEAGIRLHAYLQGTNLVYDAFPDQDVWARDNFGRYISYYKGRRMTCVNNPLFQRLFFERLERAVTYDFDGIFIDNVNMGQPAPYINGTPITFAGCRCQYCQALFREQTGVNIPRMLHWSNPELLRYFLEFRIQSILNFLKKTADIVHEHGKLFGTNSYDPKFDGALMFGIDYQRLAEIQDYLLFETLSFPRDENIVANTHAQKIASEVDIPVFVITYETGIGFDGQPIQSDIERLYHEAGLSDFHIVYKGSEYTTDGVWHNLRLDQIHGVRDLATQAPVTNKPLSQATEAANDARVPAVILKLPFVLLLLNLIYGVVITQIMENRYIRPLMARIQRWLVLT